MQTKANFFSDNSDIEFHLAKRIPFDEIFNWQSPEEREACGASSSEEFQKMVCDSYVTLGQICGSDIAPMAAQVEREPLVLKKGEVIFPPTLTANVNKLIEFGIPALGSPAAHGGLGFPYVLQLIGMELIFRSCPSSGMNIVWFSSIAHIIDLFGTEALKAKYIPALASGEVSGSMALTEPDAGSDLSALRTYGERQPDGTWRLFGPKRFISNGCGQISLVLAMNSKGATGLDNLNLYLCERKLDGKDNFAVTKIEDKVALHGSATCELNFDNSVAHLLGEENKGFHHMLVLMNDARIATAFQAVGLMEAAWRLARDYAAQRQTWGKPIAHHELIAEKLLDMEVELKALRSLSYQSAVSLSLQFMGEKRLKDPGLSDTERAEITSKVSKHRRRLRRWTPLLKWYAGEKSVEHARTGLQIHGGYGFTTEYRAEWLLRESLILAIYEGTSQIQALMCLKDTIKDVTRGPRRFIEGMLGRKVTGMRESEPLRRKLNQAQQLVDGAVVAILFKLVKTNAKASLQDLRPHDIMKSIKALKADLARMENLTDALLHAERLCEMKTLAALAECLVSDARVDASRSWVAQRFLARALPRMTMLKTEIEGDEPVILDRLNEYRGK